MTGPPAVGSVDLPPPSLPRTAAGLIWTPRGSGLGGAGGARARWYERLLERSFELGFAGAYLVESPTDLAELPSRAAAASRFMGQRRRFFVAVPSATLAAAPHGEVSVAIEGFARSLAPLVDAGHLALLEIRPGARPGAPVDQSVAAALRRATSGDGLGWGVSFPHLPEAAVLADWLQTRPTFVRWPLNLLSPRSGQDRLEAVRQHATWFLADDPFASGLLDGTRLRGAPLSHSGPPKDLAALQNEWAPVLARGFLTTQGRRTMAGAALRFLRDAPGVTGVVVPAGTTEELEAAARGWESEPLSGQERHRLERLATARPQAAAAPGDKIPQGG